jgi:hypothetical protein
MLAARVSPVSRASRKVSAIEASKAKPRGEVGGQAEPNQTGGGRLILVPQALFRREAKNPRIFWIFWRHVFLKVELFAEPVGKFCRKRASFAQHR